MFVEILKKAGELKVDLPDLITRPVGRKMFQSIKEMISSVSDGEVVLLDFKGIKVIDSSFIDEFLINLIQYSKESVPEFYIKLKNISEIAEINIDLVFKSYSNYKNDKIVVITENICHNNNFFIGPLSDSEKDIVEFIRVNKSVSSDDLIRFSGLSSEKINKLMENLNSLRVVRREEGVFLAV